MPAPIISPTDSSTIVNLDSGPPPSTKKPKKSSLYSSAGAGLMSREQAGLGAEGGDQTTQAMQYMGMVVRGIKGLSTILPGVTPITSDLLGRLQMILPQLLQDLQNGGPGMVNGAGIPPQQPVPGPPAPMGPPGMGGGPPMPPPPVQ